MSRLVERRIGNNAWNAGSSTRALDPKLGGQQGYASDVANIYSNSAHKQNQLIAVLMESPRGFEYLDTPAKHRETLKAVIELHSLTITGFDDALTVDTDQHTIGSAGQVQQEFVNVTRAQPTPTHSFIDKEGRPIQKFFTHWIRYFMMDPDINHPLAPIVGTRNIQDMGLDMYSMTVLYFEPNITWTGVNRAWLCVGMWPQGNGTGEARRDLTQGASLLQYDITFSSVAQVGFGVEELALGVLNGIRTLNADNYFREAAVSGISADVRAVGDNDFKGSVEKTGRQAIQNVYGLVD